MLEQFIILALANEINAVNEEELLYSEDELESGQRPPTRKTPLRDVQP